MKARALAISTMVAALWIGQPSLARAEFPSCEELYPEETRQDRENSVFFAGTYAQQARDHLKEAKQNLGDREKAKNAYYLAKVDESLARDYRNELIPELYVAANHYHEGFARYRAGFDQLYDTLLFSNYFSDGEHLQGHFERLSQEARNNNFERVRYHYKQIGIMMEEWEEWMNTRPTFGDSRQTKEDIALAKKSYEELGNYLISTYNTSIEKREQKKAQLIAHRVECLRQELGENKKVDALLASMLTIPQEVHEFEKAHPFVLSLE